MSNLNPMSGLSKINYFSRFTFSILILIIVGQGPTALAVGAGGVVLDFFSLIYLFSFLSPSLWETARYRLKYCLKGLSQRWQAELEALSQTGGNSVN